MERHCSETLSRGYTHVLQVEYTFMKEYRLTSRKNAIVPFSASSAIVRPNFKKLNSLNSGLDHVRSLCKNERKKARFLNVIMKNVFLLTFKIY